MTPRPIIIDTDPGKDDAAAILLALASPELDVRALVTVAGNVGIARTTSNARRLLGLAGRLDIAVHAGCATPLLRPAVTAGHVHGETGLGEFEIAEPPGAAADEHGVDAMIRMLRGRAAGSITLCLLGPATNLAMALVKAPDIVPRIAEIVWMAGASAAGGNVTPAAEFNVYADPEAAQIVLRSAVPLTLVPLDVTHQVRLDAARREALRGIETRAAAAMAALFPSGMPPLHDPCVIAHLLDPTLFEGRRLHVDVETHGRLTSGMTVVDRNGVTGLPANALWLERARPDAFFALLFERLARLR